MPKSVAKVLIVLVVSLSAALAAALENRLQGHPSPYLAMHGADPVHWQDWGAEAIAAARREDKLLFVSSGYFACHWCHVMQRESYRNPEIAALLNRHFVPVKVDRELHPALDAHLIEFVERTQGRAGWPLNVFLTPDGYPVVGLTYAPAEDFGRLLRRLQQVWQERREATRELARRVTTRLAETAPGPAGDDQGGPGAPWSAQRLANVLQTKALALGDDLAGGFGNQSRFPMSPQLRVLVELQARYPDSQLREFLLLTLDQMARQGLRDHLAGGFYRYTVDPNWQVPHYEKMLYTQAQLALLYLRAAEVLLRPEYRAVAADTLEFVLRHMAGAKGGYIASLSAVDAQGEEGGAYLWTEEQLAAVLSPPELAIARQRWRLQGSAATGDGHLPRLGAEPATIAEGLGREPAEIETEVERIRQELLAARSRRSLPRDTKQLAGWNGLLLAALAEGARVLERPDLRRAAQRLKDYLLNELSDGDRLVRARDSGRAVGAAALEDYAYVAAGLNAWLRLAPDPEVRIRLQGLLQQAWDGYYVGGGWRNSAAPLLPGMAAEAAQADGALRSPTALLLELSLVSGAEDLERRAGKVLSLTRPGVQAEPFWHASHAWLLIEQAERVDRSRSGVTVR